MHHSVSIAHDSYVYPYDAEYESVLRPLRYALCELGQAYLQATSARYAVQTAGGHPRWLVFSEGFGLAGAVELHGCHWVSRGRFVR